MSGIIAHAAGIKRRDTLPDAVHKALAADRQASIVLAGIRRPGLVLIGGGGTHGHSLAAKGVKRLKHSRFVDLVELRQHKARRDVESPPDQQIQALSLPSRRIVLFFR